MPGLAHTAVVFGLLNAGIGLCVTRRYRAELPQAGALMMHGWLVLAVLLAALVRAQKLTDDAEASLYGDSIVHQETTPFQRVVLTRWLDDTRLYLNGNLQFSTRDEHRYPDRQPVPRQMAGCQLLRIHPGACRKSLRDIAWTTPNAAS